MLLWYSYGMIKYRESLFQINCNCRSVNDFLLHESWTWNALILSFDLTPLLFSLLRKSSLLSALALNDGIRLKPWNMTSSYMDILQRDTWLRYCTDEMYSWHDILTWEMIYQKSSAAKESGGHDRVSTYSMSKSLFCHLERQQFPFMNSSNLCDARSSTLVQFDERIWITFAPDTKSSLTDWADSVQISVAFPHMRNRTSSCPFAPGYHWVIRVWGYESPMAELILWPWVIGMWVTTSEWRIISTEPQNMLIRLMNLTKAGWYGETPYK